MIEIMQLPEDFIALMRQQLGEDQAASLFEGLSQEPTVSIRLNPLKTARLTLNREALGDPVPWCPDAYYLNERRAFTFDPLFHAGVYFVQDASSMFLSQILRQYMPQDRALTALDLCAAPGGKSTLLASHLPEGSKLISNEPIRKRAQVLAENMQKWGYPGCFVTQNYPEDFGHLREAFDLILTDVPCSGEGMFRKDPVAVSEWSLDNVRQCAERQRNILCSILPTLRPGGLLVYSTCTFNRQEDEEPVQWLQSEYGLTLLEERHFFPGRDRGEGLYIVALRQMPPAVDSIDTACKEEWTDAGRKAESRDVEPLSPAKLQRLLKTLNVIADVDDYNRQLSVADSQLELSYDDAIRYLRREALHLAAPRGQVLVTYRGLPLGLAKSVGTRLNNLYPQEWRIRTTYSPTEPLPDFLQ